MNLPESTTWNTAERFLVLAPGCVSSLGPFRRAVVDTVQYQSRVAELQRLRGRVYLEDGAIQASQLTADGRHIQGIDASSWHLLALDASDRISGCVRCHRYEGRVAFEQLGVRDSAMALSDVWGRKLQAAVEADLACALQREVGYAEVGGWAIQRQRRCTGDALRLAAATFGLGQLLGGCLGITTATVRHHSSSILRRIGGHPMHWQGGELPSYYDPKYGCEMEILSFDSGAPDRRFSAWVEEMRQALVTARVIFREPRERRDRQARWSAGRLAWPVLPAA